MEKFEVKKITVPMTSPKVKRWVVRSKKGKREFQYGLKGGTKTDKQYFGNKKDAEKLMQLAKNNPTKTFKLEL